MEDPSSPWTTFNLPLKESGPLPGAPIDLLRFIASSLTFMSSLKNVELCLDDVRLGHITKDIRSSQRVGVPTTLEGSQQQSLTHMSSVTGNVGATFGGWGNWGMRAPTQQVAKDKEVKWAWTTPKKLFTVHHVTSKSVHIHAEVIRWVFLAESEKPRPTTKIMPPTSNVMNSGGGGGGTSNTSDQQKVVESSVRLTVFTAEAEVELDEEMDKALHRATMKPAPLSVKVGLIYVRSIAPAVIISNVIF